MATLATASMTDARAKFPALAKQVVVSGEPVTVFKDSKPYIVISPAITFDENVGNTETVDAMHEAERMMNRKKHSYTSNADMYADLGL